MFEKRKVLSFRYSDALALLKEDENRLKILIEKEIIHQNGNFVELDARFLDFFELLLEANEEINTATVEENIEYLHELMDYYLKEKIQSRKESYVRNIKITFQKLARVTIRNIINLQHNIDNAFKHEPTYQIKIAKLQNLDKKRINIQRLIDSTEHLILHEERDFFRQATDEELTRILLHSCCGPCSTAVLDRLTGVADVTVYYFNPNIHPEAEYRRRELVQKQFIAAYNEKTGHAVQFLAAPYEPDTYFKAVQGLEDEPEGGARCRVCFIQRMKATAEKMQELGYDYFTTTLTVSPHKNSQVINEVGRDIEDQYGYAYLPTDFKKNNGFLTSTKMTEAYHLYRQPYCGCIFGARDQGLDLEKIRHDAEVFLAEHK